MSDGENGQPSDANPKPVAVGAEPVVARPQGRRVAHLAEHRRLIVRRSLMATAVGGALPIPVVDEYVTGRVRAGLYMRLAESRKVDLPAPAADVLSEPKGASAIKNATLTAATLIALRLAWRKFFAVLAVGRGAEDMATTFQTATLFDHYCAKLHVGGAIDRERANRLRRTIHTTVESTSRAALAGAFREGASVLGRSFLEAPRWASERLRGLAERWVATRGNPDATWPDELDRDGAGPEEPARWLDRATHAVDDRLAALGEGYLDTLVTAFETNWRTAEEQAATEAAKRAAAKPPEST